MKKKRKGTVIATQKALAIIAKEAQRTSAAYLRTRAKLMAGVEMSVHLTKLEVDSIIKIGAALRTLKGVPFHPSLNDKTFLALAARMRRIMQARYG